MEISVMVITNHGMGAVYKSRWRGVDESELDKVKQIFENVHNLLSFKLEADNDETYFFPEEVIKTSVFRINTREA